MAQGHINKQLKNRTGLTSLKIRHVISHRGPNSGLRPMQEVLGPRQISARAAEVQTRKRSRMQVLHEHPNDDIAFNGFNGDDDFGTSILDRSESIEISHAGGELHELTKQLIGDFWNVNKVKSHVHRIDYRTRRTEAFNKQMPALMCAYLDWHLANVTSDGRGFFVCYWQETSSGFRMQEDVNAGSICIKVVDVFYSFIASALVCQGVVPCSPISPSTGVTMQALNFYHIARKCNPHFSIQAYFYPYLSCQFSIALDVFLQILAKVDTLMHEAIGRSDPNWQLMHVCPACTYTLKGKAPLRFRLLYTMDGNDSLKRDDLDNVLDEDNMIAHQRSAELPSMQVVDSDRYLTREYVDRFAGNSVNMLSGDDEDNPCTGRWNNMKDDKTRRMRVCCHGFSLVIADMVQSGEQSKYPLAVVSKLLDVFGKDLGGGYDIGCSILGQLAHELNHTSLLDHLTTYVEGLRLEDLEGCERTFSKSNALTSSVRYSSIFHRRQAICNYFQHTDDFKVYANLSTFLHNNYKQTLNILLDEQSMLPQLMRDLGIMDDGVFKSWLADERDYLMSLNEEPKHETLQMEYWQKLTLPTHLGAYPPHPLHCLDHCDNYEKDLKIVQELEVKLRVNTEWKDAGCLVANRKFQWALDSLEGLVVARIFELSKMNRAGTGYKLRKHIGKALQARSAAIRTALDCYNAAARALSPPHPTLSWDEVVEYAFLSDFDLLRDAHQDISQCAWATPTGRLAMDTYFKMQRAQEEIQRLNVEIKRMVIARFTEHHLCCLHAIGKSPGFTGSLSPGDSTKDSPGASASVPVVCIPAQLVTTVVPEVPDGVEDAIEDLEDEEHADADGEEQSRVLEDILQVTFDA
ncbi:uncharacterized protein EDB91DRAFT_1239526 [Suillus paluster]|uniref:uncharacterized protein n=1 Tax=Suillus paluster TaxID=48578 RepID=UPI001B863E00|nr:uncharacterized protein EDB91DRAFT_1239526 [Suillus paluster]KAG1727459.1 hypothetical protein EDB91DRAFT_1239526 [Suillus paluster]